MQLVILDRDGVINQDSAHYIKTPDEWEAIPGSLEAIARLNRAGKRVVVATNQSGLGRGLFDLETFCQINEKMLRRLEEVGGTIEAIFFCPHRPDDGCECRKPRPGMLLEIGKRLHVSLTGVPVIGDTRRDIEAARAVQARPILVSTGKGQQTLREENMRGVEAYPDLAAAVDALLQEEKANTNLPAGPATPGGKRNQIP
jgi:D-glycero-D-manno-heptose 1,7-bisphosphate phosphatase